MLWQIINWVLILFFGVMWINEVRKQVFLEFAVSQANKGFPVKTLDYSVGKAATQEFLKSCRIEAAHMGMSVVDEKINNMLIVVYVKDVTNDAR